MWLDILSLRRKTMTDRRQEGLSTAMSWSLLSQVPEYTYKPWRSGASRPFTRFNDHDTPTAFKEEDVPLHPFEDIRKGLHNPHPSGLPHERIIESRARANPQDASQSSVLGEEMHPCSTTRT
jgi:hypothetical protein